MKPPTGLKAATVAAAYAISIGALAVPAVSQAASARAGRAAAPVAQDALDAGGTAAGRIVRADRLGGWQDSGVPGGFWQYRNRAPCLISLYVSPSPAGFLQ